MDHRFKFLAETPVLVGLSASAGRSVETFQLPCCKAMNPVLADFGNRVTNEDAGYDKVNSFNVRTPCNFSVALSPQPLCLREQDRAEPGNAPRQFDSAGWRV